MTAVNQMGLKPADTRVPAGRGAGIEGFEPPPHPLRTTARTAEATTRRTVTTRLTFVAASANATRRRIGSLTGTLALWEGELPLTVGAIGEVEGCAEVARPERVAATPVVRPAVLDLTRGVHRERAGSREPAF